MPQYDKSLIILDPKITKNKTTSSKFIPRWRPSIIVQRLHQQSNLYIRYFKNPFGLTSKNGQCFFFLAKPILRGLHFRLTFNNKNKEIEDEKLFLVSKTMCHFVFYTPNHYFILFFIVNHMLSFLQICDSKNLSIRQPIYKMINWHKPYNHDNNDKEAQT